MNAARKIWTVIPVKRFSAAKLRLAPLLTVAERSQLAQTMLVDVLGAIMKCRSIVSKIVVVTADEAACDLAHQMGVTAVRDEPEQGINRAIARAINHIAPGKEDGLVVVPSDIPQLTCNAIDETAKAISMLPSVAIAEAMEDGGTNLFACSPVGIIPPLFGADSFNAHCRAAQQAKVNLHVLRMPELSVDIDRPQDLLAFIDLGSRTHTRDFLVRLNVPDRLKRFDSRLEHTGTAAEV